MRCLTADRRLCNRGASGYDARPSGPGNADHDRRDTMASWLELRDSARYIVQVAALLLAVAGGSAVFSTATGADNTVRLIVDYGDGATKTISDLAWSKGNTVLDAMKEATSRSHGISFSYTGSGASAVVTKIDDVQNQGGGAGKKNWQYSVNGAYGDRSFAAFELQAQDQVVWRFATEQEK
jgi:Domain of unknown function (DUF4430)